MFIVYFGANLGTKIFLMVWLDSPRLRDGFILFNCLSWSFIAEVVPCWPFSCQLSIFQYLSKWILDQSGRTEILGLLGSIHSYRVVSSCFRTQTKLSGLCLRICMSSIHQYSMKFYYVLSISGRYGKYQSKESLYQCP